MTGALEAIQTWWSSQGLLTSQFSTPTLWLDEAPDGTATPYAVLIQVGEPVVNQTTSSQLVNGVYQISCMADDALHAMNLARQTRNAFNLKSLPQMDDMALHCIGGEIRLVKGVGMGVGGLDCWVAYTEIEILSQRI